jgi:hypothetical protein
MCILFNLRCVDCKELFEGPDPNRSPKTCRQWPGLGLSHKCVKSASLTAGSHEEMPNVTANGVNQTRHHGCSKLSGEQHLEGLSLRRKLYNMLRGQVEQGREKRNKVLAEQLEQILEADMEALAQVEGSEHRKDMIREQTIANLDFIKDQIESYYASLGGIPPETIKEMEALGEDYLDSLEDLMEKPPFQELEAEQGQEDR